MRRQMTSFALMICGTLALVLSFTMVPTPTPAAAMPALQPSPRPTLQPTPDFQPLPTATPLPAETPTPVVPDNAGDDRPAEPTPVPMGRITGTIIDLRTGAPAANILVVVGDSLVISDSYGNYDRRVPSGYHTVALQLRQGEGEPTQGAQEIAVGPGDSVTVHLFFTSPEPLSAAPEAPAASEQPVAPTAALPIAVPLPALPATGLAETSAERPAVPAPARLPVTAAPLYANPGIWFVGGVLALGFGLMLQIVPRRRRARAERALLDDLLTRPTPPSDDDVLRRLLDEQP
jgi:hypothetical protein